MECLVDDGFIERVGLNMDVFKKQSNFAVIEEGSNTVHFLPTKQKGSNFIKSIKSCKSKFDKNEIIFIINQYTYHDTWYCTKINLLLASDSAELEKEINYIKNLDLSIKNLAKIKPMTNSKCFRGMQMSLKEFGSFPMQEFVFIPSFLSTSQSEKKIYQVLNYFQYVKISIFLKIFNNSYTLKFLKIKLLSLDIIFTLVLMMFQDF